MTAVAQAAAVKQEAGNDDDDDEDYLKLSSFQQKLSYDENAAAGPSATATSDEPPRKRQRRTAAVKAQINIQPESDDEDDMSGGEPSTKVEDESEESDNEGERETAFVDVLGGNAAGDDQPGPSGVGKDAVEAPCTIQTGAKCSECGERMKKMKGEIIENQMVWHFVEKHKLYKKFCTRCGKLYMDLDGLFDHMLETGHDYLESCRVCGLQFETALDMYRHLTANQKKMHPLNVVRDKYKDTFVFCDYCGRKLNFPIEISMHLHYFHIFSINMCVASGCGAKYQYNLDLLKHYRTIHNQPSHWICGYCQTEPKSFTALICHMKTQHGTVSFICPVCFYVTNKPILFLNHLWSLHKIYVNVEEYINVRSSGCQKSSSQEFDNPWLCEVDQPENLSLQQQPLKGIHTGDMPEQIKCLECGIMYFGKRTMRNLRLHYRNAHKQYEKFCEKCGYTSVGLDGLLNHMLKTGHNKIRNCRICQMEFISSIQRNKHLMGNLHASHELGIVVEKYKNVYEHCGFCGEQFQFPCDLQLHKLSFHQYRYHACVVCDNNYGFHRDLVLHHYKYHNLPSEWACKSCPEKLETLAALFEHVKNHNIRELQCPCCDFNHEEPEIFIEHLASHNIAVEEYKVNSFSTVKSQLELPSVSESNRNVAKQPSTSTQNLNVSKSKANPLPQHVINSPTTETETQTKDGQIGDLMGNNTNTDKVWFTCGECNWECKQKRKINRVIGAHYFNHKLYKKFCEKCGELFMSWDSFIGHLLETGHYKLGDCKICGVSFGSVIHRYNHLCAYLSQNKKLELEEQYKDRSIFCETCGKQCGFPVDWLSHSNEKHEFMYHICLVPHCNVGTRFNLDLMKHYLTFHNFCMEWSCSNCPAKLRSLGNLIAHSRSHEKMSFACPQCESIKLNPDEFVSHLALHGMFINLEKNSLYNSDKIEHLSNLSTHVNDEFKRTRDANMSSVTSVAKSSDLETDNADSRISKLPKNTGKKRRRRRKRVLCNQQFYSQEKISHPNRTEILSSRAHMETHQRCKSMSSSTADLEFHQRVGCLTNTETFICKACGQKFYDKNVMNFHNCPGPF